MSAIPAAACIRSRLCHIPTADMSERYAGHNNASDIARRTSPPVPPSASNRIAEKSIWIPLRLDATKVPKRSDEAEVKLAAAAARNILLVTPSGESTRSIAAMTADARELV